MARTGARWGIVLAGGEGERLRPMTERWLGGHRPKQYCAFDGEKSMLEHTLDRAMSAIAPERLVTVIGRGHTRHMRAAGLGGLPGRVIEQPENLDTAPGVLYPLSYIRAADRDALVGVFPSDHFIRPRAAFARSLERAFELAERHPEHIVLLGAQAEGPEVEYGWIEPGDAVDADASRVFSFVEKPSAERAEACWRRGGVWNTLIMTFRLGALWSLAGDVLPETRGRFERLCRHVGRRTEPAALAAAYDGLGRANFSRDLLERRPDRALVLPMQGVEWSDWGRPERIAETLGALGKRPAFPVADPAVSASRRTAVTA